jgi:hypothetical protein
VSLTFEDLVKLFPKVWLGRSGTSGKTWCPCHADKNPSLNLWTSPSGLGLKCWAGCRQADVLRFLGLTRADLASASPTAPPPPLTLATVAVVDAWGEGTDPVPGAQRTTGPLAGYTHTASYRYRNADRLIVGMVDRFERWVDGERLDKTFRPRVPDLEVGGGWQHAIGRRVLPLYRWPELLERPAGAVVVACEGEKDVEQIMAKLPGWVATTAPGGATGWCRLHTAQLLAATRTEPDVPVLLAPDDDAAGGKWLGIVRGALDGRRPIQVIAP